MTSSEKTINRYHCDGVATEFVIDMDLANYDESMIEVELEDLNKHIRVFCSHYILGGKVITNEVYSSDFDLIIKSKVANTNLTEFVKEDPLSPEALNDALDKTALQSAEQNSKLTRTIRVPGGDGSLDELPTVQLRKDAFLYFDATTGQPKALAIFTDDLSLASPYMKTVFPVADQPELLEELGLNTLLSGSVAPSDSQGRDGDFYFETTNNRVYGPKAAGAWGPYVDLAGQGVPTGGLTGEYLKSISGDDYDFDWEAPTDMMPIGTVVATTFSAIPNGWLKLDGSLALIAEYPELYAEYGTDHGGDGITTFGLPDAQGLVLAGQGESLVNGNSKGDATKGLLEKREDAMQKITGSFNPGMYINLIGASGSFYAAGNSTAETGNSSSGGRVYLDSSRDTRTDDTFDETHGSQLLINWIVKARQSSPAEYKDPNLDQRMTDVENQLVLDTVYDSGWLNADVTWDNRSIIISHNFGLHLDALDVRVFFKDPITGAILQLGSATHPSAMSGHTFHEINTLQIRYQNTNDQDSAGLYFSDVNGTDRWLNNGSADDAGNKYTEVKFVIKPITEVGLKGADGDTGAAGAAGATGAQGIQGPNGPAIAADPYEAGTSYNTDEFCVHLGLVYISTIDSNLGNTPASSYPSWKEWNWSDGFVGMESFISVSGTAPTGWLKQDGTEYLKATYQELYDFLGSAYETDATHFVVPDKSGATISGVGTQTFTSGSKGDATKNPGDQLDDQMQGHTHETWVNSGAGSESVASATGVGTPGLQTTTDNARAPGHDGTNGTPRTGAYTRGPAIVVQFIIKARNAVPTDSTDINVDSRLSAVEAKDVVQDGRLDDLETAKVFKTKFTKVLSSEGYNTWFVEDENKEMYSHGGNNTTYNYVQGMGRNEGKSFTKIPHHPDTAGLTIVDQGVAGQNMWRLYNNGDLYACGANATGQLAQGNTTTKNLILRIQTNVNRFWPIIHGGNSLTANRFFVEKTDGTYWGVGHNGEGQLGIGNLTNQTTWQQITWLANWSLREMWNIGRYYGWVVWALNNGEIWFSGRNSQGQSGNGTTTAAYSTPIRIDTFWGGKEDTSVGEISDIVGTAAHANPTFYIRGSMCMLRADGSVRTIGYNTEGAVGNGTTTNPITSPYTVPGLGTVTEIANQNGGLATYYVRNLQNKVFRWGYNGHGQIGKGSTGTQTTPYNSGDPDDIDNNCLQMFNHRHHAHEDAYGCTIIGLKDIRDYEITWATGHGSGGAQGWGDTSNRLSFVKVFCKEDFIDIKSTGYNIGGGVTTGITRDGRILQWGYGGRYELFQQDPHPNYNRYVPFELPVG